MICLSCIETVGNAKFMESIQTSIASLSLEHALVAVGNFSVDNNCLQYGSNAFKPQIDFTTSEVNVIREQGLPSLLPEALLSNVARNRNISSRVLVP